MTRSGFPGSSMSECSLGDCIEVLVGEHLVDIWSTRHYGSILVDRDEWDDFIVRVKNGEFDQV